MMKTFYRIVFVVFLVLLFGCQQQQRTFTEVDKEAIKKEVKDRFNKLVSALNQKDAGTWSGNYSKDEFLSAIVSTDYYASRSALVDLITNYFSMRERQHIEPLKVRVTALAISFSNIKIRETGTMLYHLNRQCPASAL
jgi:hypothetical protein